MKGDVFALDLATLYPDVAAKLRGKYALVVSYGPAAKRDWLNNKPYTRFALADALFDKPPALDDVRELRLLAMTHWTRPPGAEEDTHATYFIPDGPLPDGVTAIGKMKQLPAANFQRVYSTWATFAEVRSHQWKHDQKTAKRR